MQGIKDAMAPAPQPAPQPDMTTPDGMDENAATAEEQALYDKFVAKSQILVYGEEMSSKFIAALQEAPNPTGAIGEFAAQIAFRVATAAETAGQALPGDVILHGGAEIVEALVELAESAGVAEMSEEDIEVAYLSAADKFRDLKAGAGKIDPAAAQADMQAFQQAEESGQLEQMVTASRGAA